MAAWPLRSIVALVALCMACAGPHAACAPADERAAALLELTINYGNTHFDPGTNLVTDATGAPNVAECSLGYAVALLECQTSLSRAKATVEAVLAHQDTSVRSPTRGQFRWLGLPTAEYHPRASWLLAPLLARALQRHGDALGSETTARLRTAAELALGTLARAPREESADDALLRLSAGAALGKALGELTAVDRALAEVARWCRERTQRGRDWAPGPREDTLRILALAQIWGAAPETGRGAVEQALRLCYLDLAQRVHPGSGMLAGAMCNAIPEEYLGGAGLASCLLFRDFGLRPSGPVTPLAPLVALAPYLPPDDITALVTPEIGRHVVQTNGTGDPAPSRTDTFISQDFTLGTMSGWCLARTVPVFATFADSVGRPTAFFLIQGAPAHISSLQLQNLAICSLNFDRMGQRDRTRAWVQANLGSARDVHEVYVGGTEWNGQPIAVGSRITVVAKRGKTYLAVTPLDCGPAGAEATSRRKPAVLEWEGTGEQASLQLSIYARYEDYPLRVPENDYRAGFVIQIWGVQQFDSTQAAARWLSTARIKQAAGLSTEKIPEPVKTDPVFDKHQPQPKRPYTRRTQNVHTIEYAFDRGEGNRFKLVEDLRNERVISRSINDEPLGSADWWHSPALNFAPGQSLESALNPPKPGA